MGWTGLMQGSWVMARIQRRVVTMKRDEVYIGTAEERLAKAEADLTHFHAERAPEEVNGAMGTGPNLPVSLARGIHRSMEDIDTMEKELEERKAELKKRIAALEAEKANMQDKVSAW